jgi:DNA-binding CsgD family transcriptional regulator
MLMRLGDFGPPSEIRNQTPALVATGLDFDRVLLSSVQNGLLSAVALYLSQGVAGPLLKRLQAAPVALEYPLAEGEIARRRSPQLIRATDEAASKRFAFASLLGWSEYIAVPIVLHGGVIGFLHADRSQSERPIGENDATALASFAVCFSIVYERAMLRHRLLDQRLELRQIAYWADTRIGELGDRLITLGTGDDALDQNGLRESEAADSQLRDLLTRRELEVLELMARGETNSHIARDLVVAEGTVKFHVKNILRKMHATNRADATSRYLRMTLHHNRPSG